MATSEGNFPKATGDVIYPGDVNIFREVIKAASSDLQHGTMVINKHGFPICTDMIYDSFLYDNALTKTNLDARSTFVGAYEYSAGTAVTYTYESRPIPVHKTCSKATLAFHYNTFTLYDECNNSSVDATKWTTAGVSAEDTNGIYVSQGSAPNNKVTTNDLSSYSVIVFECSAVSSFGTGSSNSGSVYFTDGTNTEGIISNTSSFSGGATSYAQVEAHLDWANKKLYYIARIYHPVQEGSTSGGSTFYNYVVQEYTKMVDITAWSSFKIQAYAVRSSGSLGSSSARIYYVRLGLASPSTTATFSVAFDGANYNTVTNFYPLTITANTGTALKIKVTGTVAANEVIAFYGWKLTYG